MIAGLANFPIFLGKNLFIYHGFRDVYIPFCTHHKNKKKENE